jgi:hypothetical protein
MTNPWNIVAAFEAVAIVLILLMSLFNLPHEKQQGSEKKR